MITLNYPFPGDRQVETLKQIDSVIKSGGVIVYPTETFYAIGGNALSSKLGEHLTEIKKRPLDKPFPCLAGSLQSLSKLIPKWPETALKIADKYWPGALTMVLEGFKNLPPAILGDDGSVAIRWSPHPLIHDLAKVSESPLISTSANLSGQPPTPKAGRLDPQLMAFVDLLIIADNHNPDPRPSTIIDVRVDPPILLRTGKVVIPELSSNA